MNAVLAGKGAVGSVLVDKYFSMRVVDEAGKGVAVRDIKMITVNLKADNSIWQFGPKPEVLGRLADETVLVDPEQVDLAHAEDPVTMRFVNGSGETMMARGTYTGDLSGMVLSSAGVRDVGVVASKKEIAVRKGDFGGRVVDESGAVWWRVRRFRRRIISMPFTPGKL